MKKIIIVTIIFFLISCSTGPSSQGSSSGQLPNWFPINTANYPTTISSITFPSGFTISQVSGVNVGNGTWTIDFPFSGSVVASVTNNIFIAVSPLRCNNSVLGEQPCFLQFTQLSRNSYDCILYIGTIPGDQRSSINSINMNCPNIYR